RTTRTWPGSSANMIRTRAGCVWCSKRTTTNPRADRRRMAIPKPNRSFDLDPPAAGRRRAPAWRRWWPVLAAAPLALVLLGWALLGGAREPGPGTRLAEVMQGDLVLGIDGYGKLVPADLVSIGSRSGGRIGRIARRPGSRVGQGGGIGAPEDAAPARTRC